MKVWDGTQKARPKQSTLVRVTLASEEIFENEKQLHNG